MMLVLPFGFPMLNTIGTFNVAGITSCTKDDSNTRSIIDASSFDLWFHSNVNTSTNDVPLTNVPVVSFKIAITSMWLCPYFFNDCCNKLTTSLSTTSGQLNVFVHVTKKPESNEWCDMGNENVKPNGSGSSSKFCSDTKSTRHSAKKSNNCWPVPVLNSSAMW